MTVTNKFSLEDVNYGVSGWHTILNNNNDILDDVVNTYIRLKTASGEAAKLSDCSPVFVRDGEFYKLNSGESCVGLLLSGVAISSGQYVLAQRCGPFTDPDWNWDPRSGEVYIGADGTLTQTMPAVNPWRYKVGMVVTNKTIILQL